MKSVPLKRIGRRPRDAHAVRYCYFHIVICHKGLGMQKRQAADQIGQQVLHGQGNRQGQDTGQCHDTADINANAGGNDQCQQHKQHGANQGPQQVMGSLFHFGLYKRLVHQLHHDADGKNTNHQDQDGRQCPAGSKVQEVVQPGFQ